MKYVERDYLAPVREGKQLKLREEIRIIWRLSVPAILAMLSSVIMQYIDAAMVGRLGANQSAAIGVVASTTWLIGGMCSAFQAGFTVLVAHQIGAGNDGKARALVRSGLRVTGVFSLCLAAVCAVASRWLPLWLGADPAIRPDSSAYFLIYALALPFLQLKYTAGGMLQCSGNMRVPGILNILMCFLDVIFNLFCIFPSVRLPFGGIILPGLGLGVAGAALGTALAQAAVSLAMLWFLLVKSEKLHLRAGETERAGKDELKRALRIALPIQGEQMVMGSAQVMMTRIVSPLGTVALAANSFAVTAESLCYMPGFGVQTAATTIVGQSYGAGRRNQTRRLAWLTTLLGMAVMTGAGVLMYVFAPQMIGLLTPDAGIRVLGTKILRIEAFVEPFFAAAMVINGVFRGVGETFVQWVMNFVSMWGVRIPLAALFGVRYGLQGVWIAEAIELTFRGTMALIRLTFSKYMRKA